MARSRLIEIDDQTNEPADGAAFAAFEESVRSGLGGLGERAKIEHAAREEERSEVGLALEQALKREPKLKAVVEKATTALKLESERDRDLVPEVEALVEATLAQLAELKKRHSF